MNGKPGDLAPHGPRTSGHGKTATGSIISTAGSSSASTSSSMTHSAMTPNSAKTPCAVQGGKHIDGKQVPKVPKGTPMNTPKPVMNRTVAPPVPPHKRKTLPGKSLAGTSLGSCAVSSTELHLGSSATVQAGVFPRQQSPPKFGAGHKHNTLGEISWETHQPGAVQAAPACHINQSQDTDQPASKKQKVSPRPPGLQEPKPPVRSITSMGPAGCRPARVANQPVQVPHLNKLVLPKPSPKPQPLSRQWTALPDDNSDIDSVDSWNSNVTLSRVRQSRIDALSICSVSSAVSYNNTEYHDCSTAELLDRLHAARRAAQH